MAPPVQGFPIAEAKKALTSVFAATPAIWDTLQGDKIFDDLVPPETGPGILRPMPYFAWSNPTDTPDGDFSSAFGVAGSSSTLQLHIFDDDKYSTLSVAALIDAVKRAISGKRHAMTGFVMLGCTVNTTGIFPTSVGKQGVLTIDFTSRTVA